MREEGQQIPEADFHDPLTVRLIPAACIDEPALAPLVDDADELDILHRLEAQTSARLAPAALPDGVDPAELLNAAHGYGWTYVNAAFCHARPGGSRFNGGDRGAWYAAFGPAARDTCRAEVIFHRTRILAEAGCFEDVGCYRELIAGFTCRFHDLRPFPGLAALDTDTGLAYPKGQALAEAIRREGGNGLLYPSARHQGGTCLAALRPSVIQNIRQGDSVVFRWQGKAEPEIVAAA